MKIEEALYSYLSSHSGLTNLVGNRIYPMILPQNTALPAVSYQRISAIRERSHEGPSGLAHPRFQFSCWGDTYKQVKDVAEQIRFALDGYKGIMNEVHIDAIYIEDDRDVYDPKTKIYHIAIDAVIWHEEATS